MLSFDAVSAKLARAKAHGESLSRRVDQDLYEVPEGVFRLVPRFDLDEAKCWLVLEQVAHPPMAEWEVILGDVLHNLQSALDRLVYELAAKPPPGSEFPIFKDRAKFERKGRGGGAYKTRGLTTEMQAAIESLQPFDEPDHPLWVLQQLSNADTHRLGITLEIASGLPVVEGPHWTDAQVVGHPRWEPGSHGVGAVIATYDLKFTGPSPDVEVAFIPTINVLIDEGIGQPPRPLIQVLPSVMEKVESIVSFLRKVPS